jgi:hypothetical protein
MLNKVKNWSFILRASPTVIKHQLISFKDLPGIYIVSELDEYFTTIVACGGTHSYRFHTGFHDNSGWIQVSEALCEPVNV